MQRTPILTALCAVALSATLPMQAQAGAQTGPYKVLKTVKVGGEAASTT